jgi:putative PIN family toxin of toxin-antitoxin system
MKIALDTNVLIAAFVSHGACAELFEYCALRHTLITYQYIIEEFRRVLSAKLKFSRKEVESAAKLLLTRMALVQPSGITENICRDSMDDLILGTAVAGNCHCLISGDKDLLELKRYKDIAIVSPGDFWKFESKQR